MTTREHLIAAVCDASEELDRRRARLEQWVSAHEGAEPVSALPDPAFARTRPLAQPSRYDELRNRNVLILK